MFPENGADLAANDTPLASQNTEAAENTEIEAGDNTEADGEDTEAPEDDEEELDVDGEKYRIPRKVREALAKPMLSDYTKKTQELAEQRKAFDGEREGFTKEREAKQAHFETAAKVISLNNTIKEVDENLTKYANVDWQALAQTNPDAYQQHRAYYDTLRDRKGALTEQRDSASRAYSEKEREFAEQANRQRGERLTKATAEIAKLVEGWAPGNDLDQKLAAYGNSRGFSHEDMAELAIRNPKFVAELERLRKYDEAEAKKKQQQTFEKSQQAQPVKRVGGAGGSATRKTTDASGDALSTEEWARRETERVAAQRKALGRR